MSSQGNPTGMQVGEEGEIDVKVLSLDEILREVKKVDLLKIDIEGSEREVFESISTETLDKIQCIFLEIHDKREQWYQRLLEENGFKVYFQKKFGNLLIATRLSD